MNKSVFINILVDYVLDELSKEEIDIIDDILLENENAYNILMELESLNDKGELKTLEMDNRLFLLASYIKL